jgi:hypothetical protein
MHSGSFQNSPHFELLITFSSRTYYYARILTIEHKEGVFFIKIYMFFFAKFPKYYFPHWLSSFQKIVFSRIHLSYILNDCICIYVRTYICMYACMKRSAESLKWTVEKGYGREFPTRPTTPTSRRRYHPPSVFSQRVCKYVCVYAYM